MKCKNCSHEFDGRYCNACGQEIAGRINLKHIWTQIADDIFNIDKGLIYTIKSLWINPGKTAADYIEGKRKNYYGPVKYLILWTAIFFIISPFVNAGPQGNSITQLLFNQNQPFSSESLTDFLNIYIELLVRYTDLFYLGMVPFFAVLSHFLFRTRQLSMIELFIPYLYLTGQLAFVLVITLPFVSLSGKSGQVILMIIPVALFLYLVIKLHRQLFQESWLKTVIKSLTVIYAGQIIYGLIAYAALNLLKAVY